MFVGGNVRKLNVGLDAQRDRSNKATPTNDSSMDTSKIRSNRGATLGEQLPA